MSEAQFESEAIRAAGKVVKNSQNREIPKEVVLSNGIVLSVKAMPPMLLNSVANSIPEPPVPKIFIEEKGREEENPNHPAYIKALEDRQVKLGMATNNLILYACTKIKELPEGISGPDKDDWIPLARMAGLDVDSSDPVQRYVTWLKCVAIENVDDMTKAMQVPIMLAGVSEEEVSEVMDAFRSGEGRTSDTEISSEQPSSNGNNVQNIDARSNRAGRRARG